jgi:hypothetical protein
MAIGPLSRHHQERRRHISRVDTQRHSRGGMAQVARPLTKAMMGLGQGLFRLFPERTKVQGRPLLLLTTVGAKSGRRRQTVLGWFPDPRR